MTMTSTESGTSGASQRWGASADVMETGRVLVAEDDAALRELLVEVLTGAGHRVIAVPNGAEALARLQHNESVDAVLTDLIMRGVGGGGGLAGARARGGGIPEI